MTVTVAVVGAGGIGSLHLDHLHERDDVSVVGVCDVDENVAREAGAPHDAATFTAQQTMYEELTFDAVVIAVPPFAHPDPERLAARHGVDCFIEKPLGLDGAVARETAGVLRDADVLTQVGHMTRYAEAVEHARTLVGDRTVALIDAHWWCDIPGDADHWWRSKHHSGGQVIEQATHTYDIVRYFGGDVETVSAIGGQEVYTETLDFDDSTAAVLEHSSGTISQVSATATAPAFSHTVRLAGDGFALTVDVGADTLTGTVDGQAVSFQGEAAMYATEMDAFIDAVETRDRSLCRSPYDDALKTFETTLAVERAIQTGEKQVRQP